MSNDLKAIFNKQKREENIAKQEKYIQAHQQEGFTEKEADFLAIKKYAINDKEKALDNFLKDYDKVTFNKLKQFFENHQECVFIRDDRQGYYTLGKLVKLDDEMRSVTYQDIEFGTIETVNMDKFIKRFNVSRCK